MNKAGREIIAEKNARKHGNQHMGMQKIIKINKENNFKGVQKKK